MGPKVDTEFVTSMVRPQTRIRCGTINNDKHIGFKTILTVFRFKWVDQISHQFVQLINPDLKALQT